jgi:hypothetical protein
VYVNSWGGTILKLLGFLLTLLAMFGLQSGFTFSNFGVLLLGLFLVVGIDLLKAVYGK